jgi:putative glycosyltransferase (TIGR04372 family)
MGQSRDFRVVAVVLRFISQKLKEGYWEVTRAIGLEWLHGKSWAELCHEAGKALRRLQDWLHQTWPRLVNAGYSPLACILRRAGVHFVAPPGLQLDRIGHLAVDIDSYLKDRMLAGRKGYTVLVRPPSTPNQGLFDHWKRHVFVVEHPLLRRLIAPLLQFPGLATKMREFGMMSWQAWDPRYPFEARRGASPIFMVQDRWMREGRPPLLELSAAEQERGRHELRKLGIPDGAWFACVHAREGGYSPSDEWSHLHRNSEISAFKQAMAAIVDRGGWCVRVGDATMRPLDPMPRVVDYALSPSKSQWMDIFLCASCRFFVGTSSGLFLVADLFGKRSAIANMTPYSACYSPYPLDLSIPKLLRDAQGRVLSFPEIFKGRISELKLAPEFEEYGLTHLDSASDDIAELAVELMDILDGTIEYDAEDDRLQEKYRSLLQPYHFSWGAPARIGRAFLRKYKHLLDVE